MGTTMPPLTETLVDVGSAELLVEETLVVAEEADVTLELSKTL